MKSSLVLIALLIFAAAAQAQHSHQVIGGGDSNGNGGYGGGSWGSGGVWGSSPLGSGGLGTSSFPFQSRSVIYEDRREFSAGSLANDGEFVPSTFMNYDDALRLGREMLAAQEKAARGDGIPSLGEIARAYRIVKIPTLRLQGRVTQDNAGRLQVCDLNGNNCHRP